MVTGGTEDNRGAAVAVSIGHAEMRDSSFESNFVSGSDAASGGAVCQANSDVLVEGCAFTDNTATGNTAGKGGALAALSGEAVLRNCSFRDNLAVSSTGPAQGGGVFLTTKTTLLEATFWDNTATTASGSAYGGGVYYANTSEFMDMRNCTVSANSAISLGGGIAVANANATFRHITVSKGNFAEGGGSGISLSGASGFVKFENCLVAGNLAILPTQGPDIQDSSSFTLEASGANLIGNNTTVTNTFPEGLLVGTAAAPRDPVVGALADYGGLTLTTPLLSGSPAVDAALNTSDSPFLDQRGFARVRGDAPDIGAYETDNDAGYVPWTMEQIPSGSDTNFTADLEPDEVVNGWEYGQRLNPTNSDTFTLTPSYIAPSNVLLSFPYRAQAPDLIYTVESTDSLFEPFSDTFSIDLSTYATTVSVPNVTLDIDPVAETITYVETVTVSDTQSFWRLVLQLIQ